MNEQPQPCRVGDAFPVNDEIHEVVIGLSDSVNANLGVISDLGRKNAQLKDDIFDMLRAVVPETDGWEFSYDDVARRVVLMYRKA